MNLAKRLMKSQSFVAKYEGCGRRIDLVELLAIARAMRADLLRILPALMRR